MLLFSNYAARRLLVVICFFTLISCARAQDTTGGYTYAFRAHYGLVYAHTKLVENTAGAHPRGFEFEVAKQRSDKNLWEYYRCYPRTGFLFSYYDLNTPILGKSFSASYFIEPNYRLSSRASFFIRAAAGLSYLTNPHDSIKNPANQSYSMPVNAFLSLGTGVNYNISPHWALSVMASFQHNSNGGFELPNHGINFLTASIGVRYSVNNNSYPQYRKGHVESYRNSRIDYDAGLYYSPKSGYKTAWVSQRKFLVGGFIQASKRVSTLDAITLSLEAYHDGGLASIKKILSDNSPSNLVGLMIGHEFIFRRILFSTQLGYYIHKDTKTFSELYSQEFPALYHRWGLRYKLNTHWYAGFNMLVHKQVADFIDVRVQYRF